MVAACRLTWTLVLSALPRVHFTGRFESHARRAAMCWTVWSSFPPYAPPTYAETTRTFSTGRPSVSAMYLRPSYTFCSPVRTRTTPSASGGQARALSGSMKAWSVKGVVKLARTTCAAEAIAPAASPRLTAMRESTFPAGWIAGAPGARAAAGERTGSRTSYSAAMSPSASSARAGVSAATTATASPTQRVTSPTAIMVGQSATTLPVKRLPGMSCQVATTATPGSARAADTSSDRSRARGCGVRSTAPNSIPGSERSSTYRASPRIFRAASTRSRRAPIPACDAPAAAVFPGAPRR